LSLQRSFSTEVAPTFIKGSSTSSLWAEFWSCSVSTITGSLPWKNRLKFSRSERSCRNFNQRASSEVSRMWMAISIKIDGRHMDLVVRIQFFWSVAWRQVLIKTLTFK